MKCNNLIIITGETCSGKTHITLKLKEQQELHSIHTDQMYLPEEREGLKCLVGEECEEKNRMIRDEIPKLTETTIIEGMHIANQKELDIFTRELGFSGNIYIFVAQNSNQEEWFKKKYEGRVDLTQESSKEWFESIYNIQGGVIVEGFEDVIKILEENNVYLSR